MDADADKAVAESIAQFHHSGNAARAVATACACVFFYDNVAHNLFLQHDKGTFARGVDRTIGFSVNLCDRHFYGEFAGLHRRVDGNI